MQRYLGKAVARGMQAKTKLVSSVADAKLQKEKLKTSIVFEVRTPPKVNTTC